MAVCPHLHSVNRVGLLASEHAGFVIKDYIAGTGSVVICSAKPLVFLFWHQRAQVSL